MSRAQNARQVMHSSESTEWHTPPRYVQLAREVMGSIDLDPASCAAAQKRIRAKYHYTIAEDGLSRAWFGRTWLNPPYGPRITDKWVYKAEAEYSARRVEQLVLLVNAVPERQWFQPLWKRPLCFTDHRIDFLLPDGTPKGNPSHGNVFAYYGPVGRWARFRRVFSEVGHVVLPDFGVQGVLL